MVPAREQDSRNQKEQERTEAPMDWNEVHRDGLESAKLQQLIRVFGNRSFQSMVVLLHHILAERSGACQKEKDSARIMYGKGSKLVSTVKKVAVITKLLTEE